MSALSERRHHHQTVSLLVPNCKGAGCPHPLPSHTYSHSPPTAACLSRSPVGELAKNWQTSKASQCMSRPRPRTGVLSRHACPTVTWPCQTQKLGHKRKVVPGTEIGRVVEGMPRKLLAECLQIPIHHSNSGPPQSCIPVPGSPISCFSPSNFSIRQAAYVDSSCWDSLMHHEQDELGQYKLKSLWPHKVR